MDKVDYDARLHAVYDAGRRMAPDALETWMNAFAVHLPRTRPLVWLDVGSGTGRMTPSLADTFGGPVYGVEPSGKMRAQAVVRAAHHDVTYLTGSAERIPLPDASCDAALLFYVWHHVADRREAARELRRVVRPGGALFVQVNYVDRMSDIWWFRVVPEWRPFDPAPFRSEEEATGDLVRAGWTLEARDDVTWLRSPSLSADLERLELRSVSLFEQMSEELAESGFAKIRDTLHSLPDGPQYETSTLLVFRS